MLLFAASVHTPVATRAADPPLAPDEIRERRLFREERPFWREVLALPADALVVLAWPVKRLVLWMEDVNLPRRIEDAATFPVRAIRREGDR
jgi:hypothetical protein